MFSLSYQNQDVETCCEEINVKSFVKLQFRLKEVRETERTRWNLLRHFALIRAVDSGLFEIWQSLLNLSYKNTKLHMTM